MFYQAELNLLKASLERCHLTVRQLPPQALIKDAAPDLGLRSMLGLQESLCAGLEDSIRDLQPRTLYLFRDAFRCIYFFFLLPETEDILLVGPFTDELCTRKKITETFEERRLPNQLLPKILFYYGNIPCLNPGDHIFTMVEVFCEHLWHDQPIDFVQLNAPKQEFSLVLPDKKESEDPLWKMELMEKRYQFENEIMDAVSKGQFSKAAMLLPAFSQQNFEERLSDPLRNCKNYCIIMNTLLRKAAENGSVHPVFLDRLSSEYARKIENISSVSSTQTFMAEMYEQYCRLVRKHSTKNYSLPVQKTIIVIESNLATDLSLSRLAELQKISPSYLSKLFKKETGANLTEYVTRRRMEYAASLLISTKLQIQTIAQNCGIVDVQYFSRLFRKTYHCSPVQYRKSHQDNP